VFADLAAVDPYHDFSVTGGGDPERVNGMRVTVNYFQTLGMSAFLGRTFLPGEDEPGRDRVVLLTYSIWQLPIIGCYRRLSTAVNPRAATTSSIASSGIRARTIRASTCTHAGVSRLA